MNEKIPYIFGHRGSAGKYPENTMISFRAAQEEGVDGIEFDVQLSKDNVPVVIHDEKLNRTTSGKGYVKDYTLQELQTLDAGRWFHQKFKGETIPTLEQVLQWAKQYPSLQINIELKNGKIDYPNIEDIVVQLVQDMNMLNKVIISSFNHYSIAYINNHYPSVDTAILYMEQLYEPWHYAREIGANGLHCYYKVVTSQLIKEASDQAMPLRTFTVNSERHLTRLISARCHTIMTDYPTVVLQLKHRLNNKE